VHSNPNSDQDTGRTKMALKNTSSCSETLNDGLLGGREAFSIIFWNFYDKNLGMNSDPVKSFMWSVDQSAINDTSKSNTYFYL
jgi:hypothetical protein